MWRHFDIKRPPKTGREATRRDTAPSIPIHHDKLSLVRCMWGEYAYIFPSSRKFSADMRLTRTMALAVTRPHKAKTKRRLYRRDEGMLAMKMMGKG